jgi:hypothetical protein
VIIYNFESGRVEEDQMSKVSDESGAGREVVVM